MDLITTPAPTNYTPPATSIVHNVAVSLTDRAPTIPVHIVQYDMTMPIVAVSLSANKDVYTVPAGAAVNFRMAKTDGNYIYNPALGVSADGQTVYVAITQQTAAAYGTCQPIVEIVLNGAVAASGAFTLIIDKNPVPESAIESTDEYQTIQQIAAQVQQAADLLEQQSANLQNLTDNLEAVQNAAANATSAAQSAAQAAQSAQQALGFRTFFDAISPDANGSLDPSRPMTTAAAQASWTVKSKGDRIQSVQVNGFTSDGQSGGVSLIEAVFDGSSDENWVASSGTPGLFYTTAISATAKVPNSNNDVAVMYTSRIKTVSRNSLLTNAPSCCIQAVGGVYFQIYDPSIGTSIENLKAFLQRDPLIVYYAPADESQATGLYIPIEIQGHEYRCQCLPITKALGVGDNVQSNVPSGCDKSITFSDSTGWWVESTGDAGKNRFLRYITGALNSDTTVNSGNPSYCDRLARTVSGGTYNDRIPNTFTIYDGKIYVYTDGGSLESFIQSLTKDPITLWYKTADYVEQADIPVELETHANGNVYAHDPVTLVAVPYTEADATAAQQLAATPSTLPYIDSADVPMLLDAAEPAAAAAPLASTLPVAGTYVVSSQDGTTVAVTLKAFQDGGDAATLGGQSLEQINGTYLTKEQLLTLVYPVGSIYMSVNNVSPQTFLGGTWQQIQGRFLLAASGSYPAGSTGGNAQHSHTLGDGYAKIAFSYSESDSNYLVMGEPKYGIAYSGQQMNSLPNYSPNSNISIGTPLGGSTDGQTVLPPYLAVYMWQRTA